MNLNQHIVAIPCRCGGQAKIFGPSEYAPTSHWGVYCSKDSCEKMAVAESMDDAIELWNEDQALEDCFI